MSSGNFARSRYQASYSSSQIHPIKVQPETLEARSPDTTGDPGLDNTAPTGEVTNPISALSSLSRRSRGLRPRYITGRWTGTVPAGYSATGTVRIVALTEAFYDDCIPGQSMTYLGQNLEIVSREPERVS